MTDIEHEDDVTDEVRLRAMETIERVDDLLSEPRPYAEGAAEFEKLARERAEPVIQKRAAPEVVRKVRLQEPESPPVSAKLVKWSELTDLCKTIADTINRIVGDTQAALDRRDVRIRDLETRLARIEGRVADVESRKSKK